MGTKSSLGEEKLIKILDNEVSTLADALGKYSLRQEDLIYENGHHERIIELLSERASTMLPITILLLHKSSQKMEKLTKFITWLTAVLLVVAMIQIVLIVFQIFK